MEKLISIKFTRNPKFTPQNMTNAELSRCERIAKAYFARFTFKPYFDKGEGETVLFWIINEWRGGHTLVSKWLDDDARYAYTRSCVNYLIVCGLNSGELGRSNQKSSSAWAMASGYYG